MGSRFGLDPRPGLYQYRAKAKDVAGNEQGSLKVCRIGKIGPVSSAVKLMRFTLPAVLTILPPL